MDSSPQTKNSQQDLPMSLTELIKLLRQLMATVRVTNPIAKTDPETAITEMARICLKFPVGSIKAVIRGLQDDTDAVWPTAGAMCGMLRDAEAANRPNTGNEDVWRNIWQRSIDTWSQHLAAAYARKHPGLGVVNKNAIRFQGYKLALGKGAGVVGVKPHSTWDGERCLSEVGDYLKDLA